MEKESALYQLMSVRMNGVINDITNSDKKYQEIVLKSDEYSGRLERIGIDNPLCVVLHPYLILLRVLSKFLLTV